MLFGKEAELYDRFIDWLDVESNSYTPDQMIALWEEFMTLKPWEEYESL